MQFFSIHGLAGLLALQASLAAAGHNARHEVMHAVERRHHRHHAREGRISRAETSPLFTAGAPTSPSGLVNRRSFDDVPGINKRSTCAFPTNAGLVAVTPGSTNGGWAIPPDTSCNGGMYCPFACPSGQVMNQWDPEATSYTYPQSMNGGLKCNSDGTVSKPFPDQPYCKVATGIADVVDNTGKGCAFCQTQLPGDESMVIPTWVEGTADLAIPGPSYWVGTAAHYYINPPGVSASDGCQWGTSSQPQGNWAPYVAGGNQVSSGQSFLKLGWNPKYIESDTPFHNDMPSWGVEIKCSGPGCNGLPCAIDPSKNQVNEMVGGQSDGAGGANFCVVTVPQGVTASFVVFESGQSASSGGSSGSSSSSSSSSAPAPAPSSTAATSAAPTSTSSAVASSSTTAATTSTTDSATSSTATPSYSYAPHQLLLNISGDSTTSYMSGQGAALPTGAGGVGSGPAAHTSPIASATPSTGAGGAKMVNGGLAAAVGIAAFLTF